jgi:hypothetical protein
MRKIRKDTQRYLTACHEAAHAVLAVKLRLGVNHVTVNRTNGGYYRPQHSAMPFESVGAALLRATVIANWAGYFAYLREIRYEPLALLSASCDQARISKLQELASSRLKTRFADWKEDSRRLVDLYWPAIEVVAEQLVRKGTLDGCEVVDLVKPWIQADYFPSPPGVTWPGTRRLHCRRAACTDQKSDHPYREEKEHTMNTKRSTKKRGTYTLHALGPALARDLGSLKSAKAEAAARGLVQYAVLDSECRCAMQSVLVTPTEPHVPT